MTLTVENKFQRTYFLQVEGNDGNIYSVGSEDGSAPYLTLEFSINRGVLATVNNATFRIRNLSPQIRNQLYRTFYNPVNAKKMTLKAGYVGSPLSTIFNGQAFSATSFREEGSVDFITELDGQDFAGPLATSYSNFTLSSPEVPKVTQQAVISRLVQDLQSTGLKINMPLSVGLISDKYNGVHYVRYQGLGNTWELLQTETQKTCYIDSGKIFCLPNNVAFQGDVTVISSETGLLGVPKVFQNMLEVEMLFEPGLIPGQSVFLDTTSLGIFNSNINGTYKVTGVQHSGVISLSVGGKCKTIATLQLTPDQITQALSTMVPTT